MTSEQRLEQAADDQTYDAVIVGGGYAGLAAMQTFVEDQVRALLCEARNEPGGRTILSSKKTRRGADIALPAISERGAFFVYTNDMKTRLENAIQVLQSATSVEILDELYIRLETEVSDADLEVLMAEYRQQKAKIDKTLF